eukprot:COSAG02_NODE_1094_length_14603_cov_40.760549_3_plen_75_part_00
MQYKSKGYEYFDVWAPEIATHYGEVFWTDQGVTPLPDEIIKRFDGKVMVRVLQAAALTRRVGARQSSARAKRSA